MALALALVTTNAGETSEGRFGIAAATRAVATRTPRPELARRATDNPADCLVAGALVE